MTNPGLFPEQLQSQRDGLAFGPRLLLPATSSTRPCLFLTLYFLDVDVSGPGRFLRPQFCRDFQAGATSSARAHPSAQSILDSTPALINQRLLSAAAQRSAASGLARPGSGSCFGPAQTPSCPSDVFVTNIDIDPFPPSLPKHSTPAFPISPTLANHLRCISFLLAARLARAHIENPFRPVLRACRKTRHPGLEH